MYKLLLLECEYVCVRKCVCVSSFLAESEALRQKAQDTGPWQSVSHSFVYGDTPLPPPRPLQLPLAFDKEFLSGSSTLLPK